MIETDREDLKEGDIRSHRYHTAETSLTVSGPKIVSFVRATVGYESDSDMDAELPNYEDLIDAAHGNKAAEQESWPDGKPFGENPLEGATVDLDVYLGDKKENRQGQVVQYYELEWNPVKD